MRVHANPTRANVTLAAVCALVCGPLLSVQAQGEITQPQAPAAATLQVHNGAVPQAPQTNAVGPMGQNSITILPWIFQNGTQGAREKAGQGVEQLLTRAGFVLPPQAAAHEENADQAQQASGASAELPTLEQMLAAGKQAGSRYVLAGRAKWHTRAAWGFLSTKTKSTCRVDVQIADTLTGRYALYVREVVMDSTASASALKSSAEFIPYAGVAVSLFSAGPKTPEEQHAVLLATAYALRPWLQTWQQVNAGAEEGGAEEKEKPARVALK